MSSAGPRRRGADQLSDEDARDFGFDIHLPMLVLPGDNAAAPPPKRVKTLIPEPPMTCVICMESFAGDDQPAFSCTRSQCRKFGKFCKACLSEHFLRALKDESELPITCLCNDEIPIDCMEGILPDEEITKFKAKLEEWLTHDRIYCPIRTCSQFISPSGYLLPASEGTEDQSSKLLPDVHRHMYLDSWSFDPESKRQKRATVACPKCSTNICTSCKGQAHPDHDLDSNGKCTQKPVSDVDPETAAKLAKWGIKRCPRCGAGVRLMYGCSRVRCRCGGEFCFSCLKEISRCDGSCERRAVRRNPEQAAPGGDKDGGDEDGDEEEDSDEEDDDEQEEDYSSYVIHSDENRPPWAQLTSWATPELPGYQLAHPPLPVRDPNSYRYMSQDTIQSIMDISYVTDWQRRQPLQHQSDALIAAPRPPGVPEHNLHITNRESLPSINDVHRVDEYLLPPLIIPPIEELFNPDEGIEQGPGNPIATTITRSSAEEQAPTHRYSLPGPDQLLSDMARSVFPENWFTMSARSEVFPTLDFASAYPPAPMPGGPEEVSQDLRSVAPDNSLADSKLDEKGDGGGNSFAETGEAVPVGDEHVAETGVDGESGDSDLEDALSPPWDSDDEDEDWGNQWGIVNRNVIRVQEADGSEDSDLDRFAANNSDLDFGEDPDERRSYMCGHYGWVELDATDAEPGYHSCAWCRRALPIDDGESPPLTPQEGHVEDGQHAGSYIACTTCGVAACRECSNALAIGPRNSTHGRRLDRGNHSGPGTMRGM